MGAAGWGLEAGVLVLFVADETADMLFAGAGPATRTLLDVLDHGLRDYFAIPGYRVMRMRRPPRY